MMLIEQFHIADIQITSESLVAQPFNVELEGIFRSEQGTVLTIPGFYDGDNNWIVRFSPTEIGDWAWTVTCDSHPQLNSEGSVTCVPNRSTTIHGGLQVNPENTRCFRYEDGADYFMVGYEVDWLFALYMAEPETAIAFVDKIAGYGFNSAVMNVYAHECSWSDKNAPGLITPPLLYPWAGDNDNPDHSQLNPAFFQQFDQLMQVLLERGVTAHLFFYVYNKSVNWPQKGSPEDRLYLDYIVARYQAFSNVIWDYAKEAYYQNDKVYLVEMLQRIRDKDAYQRLLTVHDDKGFCVDPKNSAMLDFLTLQHHQDFNILPQYEYLRHGCPVLNSEYAYECGPGGLDDITYGEGNVVSELMDRTYNVAMGGGAVAYYYTYTAWDIIRTEETPAGYASFKVFSDLFTSLPWWRYEPRVDLCMWTPTACFADEAAGSYLLKMNVHGRFLMDKDFSQYDVEGTWIHIVSGETRPMTPDTYRPFEVNPTMTVLTGPFRSLSVLLLTLKEG